MGVATFAGRKFRIDPESVAWDFKIKNNDFATVGGKVIQVYGTSVSDMTVIGSFGNNQWRQQLEFLSRMKEIASAQARAGNTSRNSLPPARFTYPPKKWDMLVYLSAYTDAQGGKAIRHHNTEINPKWRLTLFIVEDISELGVKKVAQDAYISRLAKGMGWQRTEFNGPLTDFGTPIENTVGGITSDPKLTGGSSGGNPADGGVSGFIPEVERYRGLVAKYFPPEIVNQALSVMQGESRGNPNAVNSIVTKYGNAKGLFQHLNDLWVSRSAKAGISGPVSIFDPESNIRVAGWLWAETRNWNAWSTKPKVL